MLNMYFFVLNALYSSYHWLSSLVYYSIYALKNFNVALSSNSDCAISCFKEGLSNEHGYTPGHCAAKVCPVYLKELFTKYPELMDLPDNYGFHPLSIAINTNNAESVEILTSLGAKLWFNRKEDGSNNVLHHLAVKNLDTDNMFFLFNDNPNILGRHYSRYVDVISYERSIELMQKSHSLGDFVNRLSFLEKILLTKNQQVETIIRSYTDYLGNKISYITYLNEDNNICDHKLINNLISESKKKLISDIAIFIKNFHNLKDGEIAPKNDLQIQDEYIPTTKFEFFGREYEHGMSPIEKLEFFKNFSNLSISERKSILDIRDSTKYAYSPLDLAVLKCVPNEKVNLLAEYSSTSLLYGAIIRASLIQNADDMSYDQLDCIQNNKKEIFRHYDSRSEEEKIYYNHLFDQVNTILNHVEYCTNLSYEHDDNNCNINGILNQIITGNFIVEINNNQ